MRTCVGLDCEQTFVEFCHNPKRFCSQKCFHLSMIGSCITEEHKAIISQSRKRDWANGSTYASAIVGKTKWHDHIKPSGETIRLQGTWEVMYAKYLDDQKIVYLAHTGAIWYVRSCDNTKRVYLPDFFLPNTNEFIDVKNDYLLRIDKQKIEDVKSCNPTIKLRIVSKRELITLGLMKN